MLGLFIFFIFVSIYALIDLLCSLSQIKVLKHLYVTIIYSILIQPETSKSKLLDFWTENILYLFVKFWKFCLKPKNKINPTFVHLKTFWWRGYNLKKGGCLLQCYKYYFQIQLYIIICIYLLTNLRISSSLQNKLPVSERC